MSAVTLTNVTKSFGALNVVHGIDLDIPDGEFVVLLGPSGCGKTTTLRMIAGLEDSSSGEIRIGGQVVNDVAPKDRKIAMVFQNYALYPHMTVRQNMEFALKPQRLAAQTVTTRIAETADMLGLTPLLERRPAQLSGGQRQRVAMGRAMVRTPEVFLFDEPLSNLDAKLRSQVRLEISKLHKKLGTTVVYVTHDQVEAMTLADKIVIMKDGHIEQAGSPREIFARPKNIFVATFIGSPAMNLIPGTAKIVNGERRFVAGDIDIAIPAGIGSPIANGAKLVLGIRPNDVHVAAPSGSGALRGKVEVVEFLGFEALVDLRLGEHELMAQVPASGAPVADADIAVAFDAAALHIFDAGSGTALT